LLALSEGAGVGAQLLSGIPVFGPILSSAINVGGVFGYVSTACMLSSVVGCLMASETPVAARLQWMLGHAAIGLALSPLWVPAAAVPAPVASVGLACSAGLSTLLSARVCAGRSTWQTAMMGICVGVAVAPMASSAALGRPTPPPSGPV
jgi:hypothetical protein